LKPRTVIIIASPGNVAWCGESRVYDRPSASVARYDSLVQLLGEDHLGIGSNSVVGDHVCFTRALSRRRLEHHVRPHSAWLPRGGDPQIAGQDATRLLRCVIGQRQTPHARVRLSE